MRKFFAVLFVLFYLIGCQTAKPIVSDNESIEDVQSALESVAEALAGKTLTEEEKKELADQIKNNPQAKSAIEAITNSMKGQKVRIKYSPTTGKRYSPDLEYDPETGEKLEWLE